MTVQLSAIHNQPEQNVSGDDGDQSPAIERIFQVVAILGTEPSQTAGDVYWAWNIGRVWAFSIGIDAVTDEQHEVGLAGQHKPEDQVAFIGQTAVALPTNARTKSKLQVRALIL